MKQSDISEKRFHRRAFAAVACCCAAAFWPGAIAFGYPGVMSAYWQQVFQIGAGAAGSVVTFMLAGLSVGMFFSGPTYLRLGMRRCILLGMVFQLVSFLVLMRAGTVYIVYLWAFLVNFGASFIYGPGLTTVQQWLPHRKGLASGLINLIFGISAAVMSPVWNRLLETKGYTAVNIGLIVCIGATDLLAMLFAGRPAGLPSGEQAVYQRLLERNTAQTARGGARDSLTVAQTLKTRRFWLIWAAWVFMGAAGISLVSLAKSYALFLGLSGTAILTAFNLTNGVGRLAAGLLCDTLGGYQTGAAAFSAAALGYFFLPHCSSLAGAALCAACVGLGLGTLFTVTGPIATGRFGMKYFSIIFGLIFTAYGFVGGVAGPLLAGIVLEKTGGNYAAVFTYLGIFALISAALFCAALVADRNETRAVSI